MKAILRKSLSRLSRLPWYLPIAALIAFLYTPFILHGGFIIDDWGLLHLTRMNPGFWPTFTSWFPLLSNRPLAAAFLSMTGNIFGGNAMGYILSSLSLWFAVCLMINLTFRGLVSSKFHLIFTLLFAFPVIAATVIFSPAMQAFTLFSILMWSVSLYCTSRYLRTGKGYLLWLSHVLVLISMLTYEVVLPLLVINVFLPWAYGGRDALLKDKSRFVHRHILPLLLVLVAVTVFQKVIMPHYMVVYSRLTLPPDIFQCASIVVSWFAAIFLDLPWMMLKSLATTDQVFWVETGLAVAAVTLAWMTLIKDATTTQSDVNSAHRRLFWLVLAALLATVILFVLGGSMIMIQGYINRALSSAWLALALVMAFLNEAYPSSRKLAVTLLMALLIVTSFVRIRDNYLASARLQAAIIEDVTAKARQAGEPGMFVLGFVPPFLPQNFNDEDVFGHDWDFGNAVSMASGGFITGGNTVNLIKAKRSNGIIIDDSKVMLDGYSKFSYSRLYYYTYRENFRGTTLVKIDNPQELRAMIAKDVIGGRNSQIRPIIFRIHDALKTR